MIERHGVPSAVDEAPTWRLVVSPMKGIFRRSDHIADVGASLPHSTRIGEVSNLRDTVDVMAPHGGTIVEWIVEDGDPVSPGQPIVRLHPHHEEATA